MRLAAQGQEVKTDKLHKKVVATKAAERDGYYESQKNAIRKVIDEKGNWYQLNLSVETIDSIIRQGKEPGT